jgi:hypothetical protein
MGAIMAEDDVYISGLFDTLNLRFGPSQGPGEMFGGIDELAVLQKEFEIFKPGRALSHCFAVLNLGGLRNDRAKNRWFKLIDSLKSVGSDKAGIDGEARILDVIIANLAATPPLPMHFGPHDARGKGGAKVTIETKPHGPFYTEQDHIVVSVPMKPRAKPPTGETPRTKKPPSPKTK